MSFPEIDVAVVSVKLLKHFVGLSATSCSRRSCVDECQYIKRIKYGAVRYWSESVCHFLHKIDFCRQLTSGISENRCQAVYYSLW